MWSKFRDIPVHGDPVTGKATNNIRIYFENVDGFVSPDGKLHNKHKNKFKQKYLSLLMSRLDVDLFGGAETRLQWDIVPKSKDLRKQLNLREGSKCRTAHNIHERFGQCQQGGTFIASTEAISTFVTATGTDPEGLGRWSWMKLVGATVTSRIIIAYQPCKTRKIAITATMAQQRRYWRLQGNNTCPRKLFRQHLITQLTEWRNDNEKLILLLDSNENMATGPLSRLLQGPDLAMVDAVRLRSQLPGPHTFTRGTRQIDGAWITPDVDVAAACFLPFYFGVGDHRAILLDIPQHCLLGGSVHKIVRPTARRLQCNRHEILSKYNNLMEIYSAKHALQRKIYSLFPPTFPASPATIQIMESVDRVITDGMTHAEKKCRRILAGEVPFSDKLAKAGRQIKVWQLVIRHKRTNNVNTRLIRRVAHRCGLDKVLSVSLRTAQHRLKRAEKNYKKYKKIALRLRHEFLCDREDLAQTTKAAREIRNIRRNEETRNSWRAINRSKGKSFSKGISQVEMEVDGEWKTVTERNQVEPAIMANNSKRFNLTLTTPLMSRHSVNKFGYLAETADAHKLLNGQHTHDPNLDEFTNKFLSFISRHSSGDRLSGEVTRDQFVYCWRSAREKTSSSISGRHFGHYKAASRSTHLSELHASFLHVASLSGICLQRWAKGLTVMIEKIDGNIRVDKLRALLLMEADFNSLNKLIFSSRMVKGMESTKRIPEELFGSRKLLSAIQVAVNRRLVTDTFRQKRRSGAIAGADAAQCYDRIIHSLSILLCRKEGVPMSSLMMMFGVIQCMTYYIRTTFGDSTTSYGGKQPVPFQGSCQGNGASPAIWLVISMYLVLIMKQEGHTTTITSPLSGIALVLIGFLFVDDTDLVVLADKDEPDTSVYSRLQGAINFWNGILRVTGGALKPAKCYWYFARFKWHKGQWELTDDVPPPISIQTDDGPPEHIAFKQPTDATKAVGVWQDLTGSSTKQMHELIATIRTIHKDMAKNPLPRHLNWIALKQSIWKTIEYVLPATTFTRAEAANLAKELYRPLLPRLGCNRNFPLLLRYNPSFLFGLGLHDPFLEQGLRKLELLLTHGGLDTMTGKLFQTSLEHHMLELGSFTSMFSLSYNSHKCLATPTWLTVLWEFVSEHDIQLSNCSHVRLSPSRLHDRAIMDIFILDHDFRASDLTSINRVRCYLEVYSLADIATGDGTMIRQCYKAGLRGDTYSTWDWHKERPSPHDFSRWKWALTFLLDETQRLHVPLGKWVALPHHDWIWYYCMATGILYRKTSQVWTSYLRCRGATRTNPIYCLNSVASLAPTGLSLATVQPISDTFVRFEGTDLTDIDTIPPSIAVTCDSYWILDHSNIQQHYNAQWIANDLRDGTLLSVCDGSYKPKLLPTGATAAWVIENSMSSNSVKGAVATAGIGADAYRCELLGIYAILSAISYIERYNKFFTTGRLRVGCDNLQAGRIASILSPTVPPSAKHFDLIKAIRRLHHSISTNVEVYHIYGHQDSHTNYQLLSRDAQLNVLVDDMAQTYFDTSFEGNTFIPNARFHHEGWTASIGGVKLQDNILPHIRNWIGKKKLRRYLYEKDLIAWNVFPLIDFQSLRIHMSAQSRAYQLWYSKHWTSFCGIGAKMQQMKLWDNDLCPCCRQVPERSTTHIFLCPHPTMTLTRDRSFHKILDWLKDVHTAPSLLDLITSFWHGETIQLDADCPPMLHSIHQTIRDIGVHQMWTGLIPTSMVTFQDQYYTNIGSKSTGQKWAVKFLGLVIRATHSLWLERNNILHLRTANGIRGLCMISMQTAVENQLDLGRENLDVEDHYLLDNDVETLMSEPAEMIRGWLCEILIARGDFASARLESLRDRGDISHVVPSLTETELRKYSDWRNVQLEQRL